MASRTTEIDDAIEQILGEYIPDALWRIDARNRICRVLLDAGVDIFRQVPAPSVIGDLAGQVVIG